MRRTLMLDDICRRLQMSQAPQCPISGASAAAANLPQPLLTQQPQQQKQPPMKRPRRSNLAEDTPEDASSLGDAATNEGAEDTDASEASDVSDASWQEEPLNLCVRQQLTSQSIESAELSNHSEDGGNSVDPADSNSETGARQDDADSLGLEIFNRNKPSLFKGKLAQTLQESQSLTSAGGLSSASATPLASSLATAAAAATTAAAATMNQLQHPRPETYIRRYLGFENCGDPDCRGAGVREHYHCGDCRRALGRREEMIRHVKWHKKRAESLALGFLRFSPSDVCGSSVCSFNGRQTHYHCAHRGCSKVYISTSDVQIHANYHRKDAAIIRQGFQRFRATEECPDSTCQYQRDRTTHFHCLRPNCAFTFKNKTDMEKHKGHHTRNDQFAKDGFRKYMKYETCEFGECKFSRLMNHIHCIRAGCDFVVHSSSQILSHCRKHERRREDAAMSGTGGFDDDSLAVDLDDDSEGPLAIPLATTSATVAIESDSVVEVAPSRSSVFPIVVEQANFEALESKRTEAHARLEAADKEHLLLAHCKRYTANDPCQARCELLFKDHQHCRLCPAAFRTKERARDHAKQHFLDAEFAGSLFSRHPEAPPSSACQHCQHPLPHLHCRYCLARPDAEAPLACLGHVRCHEAAGQLSRQPAFPTAGASSSTPSGQAPHPPTTTDWQQRRRGRPPKSAQLHQLHQYSQQHQQLPHPTPPPQLEPCPDALVDDASVGTLLREYFVDGRRPFCGFRLVAADDAESQGEQSCAHAGSEHFHCVRPRCHWASDSLAEVNLHRSAFHSQVVIHPGFEYFDRRAACGKPGCQRSGQAGHFHCVRPHCGYAFVRHGTMATHLAKHEAAPPTSATPAASAATAVPAVPAPTQQQAPLLTHFTLAQMPRLMQPQPHIIPSQLPSHAVLMPLLTSIPFQQAGPPLLFSADCACRRHGCPLALATHAHCSHPACDRAFADGHQLRTHRCPGREAAGLDGDGDSDSAAAAAAAAAAATAAAMAAAAAWPLGLTGLLDHFEHFPPGVWCGKPDCQQLLCSGLNHAHCTLCEFRAADPGQLLEHAAMHAAAAAAVAAAAAGSTSTSSGISTRPVSGDPGASATGISTARLLYSQ